ESQLVRLPPAGAFARPPVTPAGTWLEFQNGSDGLPLTTTDYQGNPGLKTGMYLLEKTDLFNLLVIPPPTREADTDPTVWTDAMAYCKQRRAMLLVDSPRAWRTADTVVAEVEANSLGLQGD